MLKVFQNIVFEYSRHAYQTKESTILQFPDSV